MGGSSGIFSCNGNPAGNLRVRFWGVQGSCPMFPEASEVLEYDRLSALELLRKVVDDIHVHSANGRGCRVEDLLGGPINEQNLEAYQRKLGTTTLPTYGG